MRALKEETLNLKLEKSYCGVQSWTSQTRQVSAAQPLFFITHLDFFPGPIQILSPKNQRGRKACPPAGYAGYAGYAD